MIKMRGTAQGDGGSDPWVVRPSTDSGPAGGDIKLLRFQTSAIPEFSGSRVLKFQITRASVERMGLGRAHLGVLSWVLI
jgi:hypothetical protein